MERIAPDKFSYNSKSRGYIIAVLGLDRSGKTSLIHFLLNNTSSSLMPTIGFAHYNVQIENTLVTFYDLGGSLGIRDIWRNYYAEVHGFIYVVDGMDQGRMEENQMALSDVLAHSWVRGKPFLLLINAKGNSGDINELEITEQLQIRRHAYAAQCPYRTVLCSIGGNFRHRRQLRKSIHWLLRQIAQSSDWLVDKISADRAVQRKQLKEENARRLERIGAMRREHRSESSSAASSARVEKENLVLADPPEVDNFAESQEVDNREGEETPPSIGSSERCPNGTKTLNVISSIVRTEIIGKKRKRKRLARFHRVAPANKQDG